MTDDAYVFDRLALRRRRDRAVDGLADHDFLLVEIGERLIERVKENSRRFAQALDLGGRCGFAARQLVQQCAIERVALLDPSCAMIERSRADGHCFGVVGEEEALPFAPHSFDLVLSNASLHAVNDLPGTLIQIRHILRPNGLFLGAILGGDTLQELRQALFEAELAQTGGVTPRVAPTIGVREAGMLMQRAGFVLPVADSDRIQVSYSDLFALMRDLRGMGESNVLAKRSRRPSGRQFFMRAAAEYAARFTGADGRVQATFEVLFMAGFAPLA